MEFTAIKTRRLEPPQDDLFSVLDESLTDVREEDIILITSKVVGIHQGRCVKQTEASKEELVKQEADYLLNEVDSLFPITIKYGSFSVAGGIDASNSGEYYSLLPERPFEAAEDFWKYLRDKHGVKKLGLVITDSYVKPMRAGVVGTSIGWWGLHPVENHRGKEDLFGNKMKYSMTNIVDSLAAGSAAVCGESGESTPIVVVRNVPNVEFTELDTRHEILKGKKEDLYYPLLKPFYGD